MWIYYTVRRNWSSSSSSFDSNEFGNKQTDRHRYLHTMPMIRCICFASRVWRSFYFICCCRCLPLLLSWFLAAIRSSAIINISFQLCGRDSALFLLFIYVILFISVPFNVNDWTKKKFQLFNQSITCVCARAWVPLSWRNSTERKKTPLNLKIGACVYVFAAVAVVVVVVVIINIVVIVVVAAVLFRVDVWLWPELE